LFVCIELLGVVNQVPVAVHALLFIAGPGIDYRLVGQHGPALVWNVEKVAVALLALFVSKGSVCLLAVLVVIVLVLNEMNEDVFGAVKGLGIEEVKRVVGGGKVTIHAVSYKPLCVVHVGRSLPRVVRKLNLVTPCAELRRCCTNHGVVGETKKRKGNEQAYAYEDGWLDKFLHVPLLTLGGCGGGNSDFQGLL
jgi:hypothetical protein